MASPGDKHAEITVAKLGSLFLLFFLIAGGLGYPVLSRYDPRQTPGLSDVKIYAEMVSGTAGADAGHVRFRVLVPFVARQIYRIVDGRSASWDPVMFSLLVADSVFVAATAVLIVALGTRCLGNSTVGLLGAFVYLVNFAVPNLRLVGLVDAGEGFFLLALLWSLVEGRLWPLPLIAILGTLTKESFVPFSIAFGAVWWLVMRSGRVSDRQLAETPKRIGVWLTISWGVSWGAFVGLHRAIEGTFTSPLEFALGLQGSHDSLASGCLAHFVRSLADHQLWYTFLWLLPTAIPKLKQFPRAWLAATGAACAVAFALDAFYGGAPGTIGRALFTIAGPVLSLSSAKLLLGLL
jgi:hypothetical protein